MKISLYGHLITDKIFIGFKTHESLGGIANVWDSLIKLNKKNEVIMKPCSIGEAIVLVNVEKNTRVGRANFNLLTDKPKIVKSDWHHIAYLNQLEDTSFINDITTGIISADVSKESPETIVEHLKDIDFLFISKEDLFNDINELSKITKGWIISHDPNGSTSTNGTETINYEIPEHLKLKNIDVLGAGDMFAGSFINNILQGKTIEESIVLSHKDTFELLKIKNS
jgi:hypothetical protein